MRAIDVSAYQGKPDWSKVKKAGVSAAILRIANRKGKDESFEHNYAGCETAGIRRGVYRYSYAKSPAEAVREALGVLNILDNRPLELGVWLDLEWSGQRALGKKRSLQSHRRSSKPLQQQVISVEFTAIWTGIKTCWTLQP